LFDWASLAWVGLVILFYWLSTQHPGLREAGLMRSEEVGKGRWELLFTSTWLHGDPAHLAMNAVLGLVLLGLAMGRLGSAAGLLAACLCGAGGNTLAWLVADAPHHSLGASGLVMGCLGLLAPQRIVIPARLRGSGLRSFHWKPLLAAMSAAVMLFVLLGLSPGTDVVAHLGGFLTGLGIGMVFAIFPGWGHKPLLPALCGLAFGVLTLWPWYRALQR
jgi:membrane associated rhomboid family serine protease